MAPTDGDRPEDRRAGARRQSVLEVLRHSAAGMTIRQLAERLDLHENTVRFHLGHLAREGLVERRPEAATGPGRPRLTFVALPDPTEAGSGDNYELLARILASYVAGTADDVEATAREAGRAWGRYQARRPLPYERPDTEEAIGELMRVLDDVGFRPERVPAEPGPEVHLRHCPFLTVATENQQVACSVHLGLMQGTLEEAGGPVTAESLQPFAAPGRCIARLGVAEPSRPAPPADAPAS